MKFSFLLPLFLCFSLLYTSCDRPLYGLPYSEYSKLTLDSLDLKNIQEKIDDTFVQAIVARKADGMKDLNSQLEKVQRQHQNALVVYWQGYLQYYLAVFHMQMGDKKASEKIINKGIELMEDVTGKNSEDLALLSMMHSFSTQFKTGMLAGVSSGSALRNVEKAMELDSQNLRAFFVAGKNDFYTPKEYGGGLEAEGHLLQAVALPDQKVSNAYLPSWGKEEAYKLLIQFYINKEDWENGKKYFQEATSQFPNSYTINQLAPRLVGK